MSEYKNRKRSILSPDRYKESLLQCSIWSTDMIFLILVPRFNLQHCNSIKSEPPYSLRSVCDEKEWKSKIYTSQQFRFIHIKIYQKMIKESTSPVQFRAVGRNRLKISLMLFEAWKSPKFLVESGFLPRISFKRFIHGCYDLKRCHRIMRKYCIYWDTGWTASFAGCCDIYRAALAGTSGSENGHPAWPHIFGGGAKLLRLYGRKISRTIYIRFLKNYGYSYIMYSVRLYHHGGSIWTGSRAISPYGKHPTAGECRNGGSTSTASKAVSPARPDSGAHGRFQRTRRNPMTRAKQR